MDRLGNLAFASGLLTVLLAGIVVPQSVCGQNLDIVSSAVNPDNGRTYLLLEPGNWTDAAATAVALSPTWVGALASEPDEGTMLNADADVDGTVVRVHRVAGPFGSVCTGAASEWVNVEQAADTVEVSDSVVVSRTP